MAKIQMRSWVMMGGEMICKVSTKSVSEDRAL
jgi:hypothetical protein